MIEARAVVDRVEGDLAWVRLSGRAGGCGRCDEPGGCRSTGIAYAVKAPNEVFRVSNVINAGVGEHVSLRIDDGVALRGALLGYGLGACLLLIGAAIGNGLAPGGREDIHALVGAVAGLLAAMALNRLVMRSRAVRGGFHIEMTRAGADLCQVRLEEHA
jgi:sigma-E factor negative regulatory protein RseC